MWKLLLADARVDPADNSYILSEACLMGHANIVKLLLVDGRVDPTANNNSAIRCASSKGQVDIVKLLIDDGRADPSVQDNLPIQTASLRGHEELLNYYFQIKELIRPHRNY